MTKKEAKKSRCCEAARLAAKTMAAIQQSWLARADQSPTGALIALRPRNPAQGAARPLEPQRGGRKPQKLKNAGVLHFS